MGVSRQILMCFLTVSSAVRAEDILGSIRAKHERIGQCRIQCLEPMAPGSRRDSDCQRHQTCRSCWQFCPRLISSKSDRQSFCRNNNEQICDQGCQIACNSFDQDSGEDTNTEESVVLRANYVGCSLYWKNSGTDDGSIFVNQLYGMDSEETWFDMGQTADDFYTLQTQQADRAVKIRLVSFLKQSGTVAETELSIEPGLCKPETSSKPVRPNSNVVQASFLLPNATQQVDTVSHASSTVLIATSSVLLSAFLLMLVSILVVKRAEFLSVFKFLHQEIHESVPSQIKGVERMDQNNRLAYYINNIDDDSYTADSFKNTSNDTQTFYV